MLFHGIAGGIFSVVQGGKFGHGFASSFISKGVGKAVTNMKNVYAESLVMGFVGGTISKATGGKFANGA